MLACLCLRQRAHLRPAAGRGGLRLDALWALAGLIDFRGDSLLPLWMVALWLMFAVVWTRLTRTTPSRAGCWRCWRRGRPGGYLIGERLGAITFLEPTFIVLSWLAAAGWCSCCFSIC
jgi:hypothetical protein